MTVLILLTKYFTFFWTVWCSKIFWDIFCTTEHFPSLYPPPPKKKSKLCTFRCIVPFGDVNIFSQFWKRLHLSVSLGTNLQSRHVFFWCIKYDDSTLFWVSELFGFNTNLKRYYLLNYLDYCLHNTR